MHVLLHCQGKQKSIRTTVRKGHNFVNDSATPLLIENRLIILYIDHFDVYFPKLQKRIICET